LCKNYSNCLIVFVMTGSWHSVNWTISSVSYLYFIFTFLNNILLLADLCLSLLALYKLYTRGGVYSIRTPFISSYQRVQFIRFALFAVFFIKRTFNVRLHHLSSFCKNYSNCLIVFVMTGSWHSVNWTISSVSYLYSIFTFLNDILLLEDLFPLLNLSSPSLGA